MKQVWHPFWDWEDYKAGMWTKLSRDEERRLLPLAIEFTGDHFAYGAAMHRVIFEWPITMEHNLTNPSINHKAFVGHCAACLDRGYPEYITRAAWKVLTDQQQGLANWQAQKAIDKWIGAHIKKKSQLGLFDEK
jgi:hypothetical protein